MNTGSRVEAYDWSGVSTHLDDHGWAALPNVLTAEEAAALASLYDDDGRFRSHVIFHDAK